VTLSCSCDWEPEPGEIVFWPDGDFTTLDTARAKRCADCGAVITPGSDVVKMDRWKVPETDIEERIYGEFCGERGEGVPRAPHYLCEDCGGLFFSLEDLGFCFHYAETQRALADYVEMVDERRGKAATITGGDTRA
jgi:hypothetical protein